MAGRWPTLPAIHWFLSHMHFLQFRAQRKSVKAELQELQRTLREEQAALVASSSSKDVRFIALTQQMDMLRQQLVAVRATCRRH